MTTNRLFRSIVTLAFVAWIKVSAEREINCDGRDFQCDGAFTYITCIYLPDGEKLYVPTRCQPGTACNPNNTVEKPCDLDSVPKTTISTAPTSTADVPTTVREASTMPYVRSTRQPDYVLSERLSAADTVNETVKTAATFQGNGKYSQSHGVSVTNAGGSKSELTANDTSLRGVESPTKVKTTSAVTFRENSSESAAFNATPTFVGTNTTVQGPNNISGSPQFVVSTFTKTFFQLSKIETQSVITISNAPIGNSNSSTVSINVATGVSLGAGFTDNFSVTTNTTVHFGSADGEPMNDMTMQNSSNQPGVFALKNNETGPSDMLITQKVNSSNSLENENSNNTFVTMEHQNINTTSAKNITEDSEDATGVTEKIPESIHSLWQHSPIFTVIDDSQPTTISLNSLNTSGSALNNLAQRLNLSDFASPPIRNDSKVLDKNHLNGLTAHDLVPNEDEGTVSKRHSTDGHQQNITHDELGHAIGALIAATSRPKVDVHNVTVHQSEVTIQDVKENSTVNKTVEANGDHQISNQNLTVDKSREGKMYEYQVENIAVTEPVPNSSPVKEVENKNVNAGPEESTNDDAIFETTTVEYSFTESADADLQSVDTTAIQFEPTTTANTILMENTNLETTESEIIDLTTELVTVTETLATTTEDLPELSTKLQEKSSISPNWPDVADMKAHPAVSETTFEVIRPNGGAFNGPAVGRDGESAKLQLDIENDNKTISTTTSVPEELSTENSVLNTVELEIIESIDNATRSSIQNVYPTEETTEMLSTDSVNLVSSTANVPEALVETASTSSTQEITTSVWKYETESVTEEFASSTTSSSTSEIPVSSSLIDITPTSYLDKELAAFVETTLSSINLSPMEATTATPTTTTTTEEYVTIFATEAPVIISIVTQNKNSEVSELDHNKSATNSSNIEGTNTTTTSDKPRKPFVCPDHGVFPDPYECRQYYLCVEQPKGYVRITGSCKERFAFDFSIQRCVRDVSACYPEKCITQGNFSDPLDNASYFWCIEVGLGEFHRYHMQCDPLEKFNPDKQICETIINLRVIDAEVPIQSASPAPVLIETDFREMPATTNKYEKAFVESFPVDGSNPLDDKIGKSIQAESGKKLVKRSISSSEIPSADCSTEGIFANPLNCSQYYMCVKGDSETGTNILRECPYRYAYHDKIKSCSRDLSVCINLHSRCQGIGNFPDPSDERSYYRCVPNAAGGLRIYHIKCEGHKQYSSTRNACLDPEEQTSIDLNSASSPSDLRKVLIRSPSQDEHKSFVASELYRKEAEQRLRVIVEEMRDEAVIQFEADLRRRENGDLADFECKEEGRFADSNNCRMYYTCSRKRSNELIKHHLQCRGSDRFDASKRICVDEEYARCA